jgi:LysM repeat protein
VPPFSSTGGDLVDQLRDWFDRQRERFTRAGAGERSRNGERRVVRRSSGRIQAVPLGAARSMVAGGRGGRPTRYRNDRAGKGAYTLILGAVLVVAIVALFFAIRWVTQPAASTATATPAPAASVTPLPGLAPISSPPPLLAPSPSPSPTTLAPPQQRFHTVEGGDTLNRIAQRYGVTVEAIMQANNFTDRNRILRIGERLQIPDTPTGSPVPVPR